MRGYLVNGSSAAIPVMLVVAIFVFSLLRLTPGDPPPSLSMGRRDSGRARRHWGSGDGA